MAGTARVMGTPIVFERAKQGDGDKKRKPRWKDADRTERHLYRAAQRSADAAAKGMRRYDRARSKSARKQRDGALIDLVPNMAKGMTTTARRLVPVPLDMLRAANTPTVRRITRRTVRATARTFDA
jgi:hypothetical protein